MSSNALIFKHIHFSCGLYCGKLSQIVFGRRQGRNCRRKWPPTPVILPGKFHGWRSLAGTVCGVAKSWTRLSDFISTFTFKEETHAGKHLNTWVVPVVPVRAWQVVTQSDSRELGTKEKVSVHHGQKLAPVSGLLEVVYLCPEDTEKQACSELPAVDRSVPSIVHLKAENGLWTQQGEEEGGMN